MLDGMNIDLIKNSTVIKFTAEQVGRHKFFLAPNPTEYEVMHEFFHTQHLKGVGTVDYFVSGAGSETRPASSNDMTKFSLEAAGFADVAIFKDTMQVSFIDHTGKTVYKIDRVK